MKESWGKFSSFVIYFHSIMEAKIWRGKTLVAANLIVFNFRYWSLLELESSFKLEALSWQWKLKINSETSLNHYAIINHHVIKVSLGSLNVNRWMAFLQNLFSWPTFQMSHMKRKALMNSTPPFTSTMNEKEKSAGAFWSI